MPTLLIVAINGWNRIQVGFRATHPLEERGLMMAISSQEPLAPLMYDVQDWTPGRSREGEQDATGLLRRKCAYVADAAVVGSQI